MAYLIDVLHDGHRFDQFRLDPGDELVFGRGNRSTIQLPDLHLSDPHVAIALDPEGCLRVRDLDSKNGTRFNEEALTTATASAGDVLRFGLCTLIVRPSQEPEPQTGGGKRTELSMLDSSQRLLFSEEGGLDSSPIESVVALAEALVGESSREALLQAAEEALERTLDFDRCFVLMREGEEFQPVRTLGVEPGAIAPMSRSVLREITLEPKALRVEDPVGELATNSDSIAEIAITSFICCPMNVQGQVLGIIYADRLAGSPVFEDSQLGFLRCVSHLLGLALHDHGLRLAVEADNLRLRQAIERRQGIVARNRAMIDVLRRAESLAEWDSPLLITGEPGTGKELIARLVHDRSPRRSKPFVPFDCGMSDPTLLDCELFGRIDESTNHKLRKGRFQMAQGGTLFLDEIGDMPLDSQAKLLRTLEERQVWPVGSDEPVPVDVRIVSATQRNLRQQRMANEFREDLYYRISMFMVDVPRLAKRGEDVVEIAESFLSEAVELSDEVRVALLAYSWPGNVRELEAVISRACLNCKSGVLRLRDLPLEIAREGRRGQLETPVRTLREMEADHISETLHRLQNNKKRAAEVLGISRDTLYQKIRQYGIET
ncbi:MAG: sigma 54-interacting transcriptional regulator [Planctomycetota bacterium]